MIINFYQLNERTIADVGHDLRSPFDSILEAVFTVSPNRVYLGIVRPTTPATHGPAIKVSED